MDGSAQVTQALSNILSNVSFVHSLKDLNGVHIIYKNRLSMTNGVKVITLNAILLGIFSLFIPYKTALSALSAVLH